MRKLVLLFGLVLLLAGCRYQNFDNGSPQIVSSSDYEDIIDMIIEKGNYSLGEKGPYSRFILGLYYREGQSVIDGLNVSVFKEYDGTESTYDTTDCFNVENILECREHESTVEGDRITPEIGLKKAYEEYASVDFDEIIMELITEYKITYREEVIIILSFSLPEDVVEDSQQGDTVIYYVDNEYVYDEEYQGSGMMLRVRVVIIDKTAEHGGYAFSIYKEIEE